MLSQESRQYFQSGDVFSWTRETCEEIITNLNVAASKTENRELVVLSAEPGKGKSFTIQVFFFFQIFYFLSVLLIFFVFLNSLFHKYYLHFCLQEFTRST